MRLKVLTKALLVMSLLVLPTVRASAEQDSVIGPGKQSCTDFITVVDGNWSHPLNALHFHGYIAWAQGMISGHNQNSDASAIMPNADELKMVLVDYCRDNPDTRFSEAVSIFFEK